MRKLISLTAAAALALCAAGCSGAQTLSAEMPSAEAVRAKRALSEGQEDLPELPTFSFEPIVVATPVPVFANRESRPPVSAAPAEGTAGEAEQSAAPEDGNAAPAASGPSVISGDPLYAGRTLAVRWADAARGRLMETVYTVPADSTPEELMKYVTKGLRTVLAGQKIQIVSAALEDGAVIVDFAPGIYLAGLSSQAELQMLDSIADSYLLNVDGIGSVIYTVEGSPYSSEHIELSEGEPYKELIPAAS